MKKLLLLLFLAAFSLSFQAKAQNNEIRANIGLLTTADIGNLFGDLIISSITIGGYRTDNSTSIGAIGLEYWHFQSDRFKIGGLFSYQAINKEVFLAGNKVGDLTDNYFSFLPLISYEYVQSEWVQLYSGVGLGLTIWQQQLTSDDPKLSGEDATELMFNFHLNAIGLRVGKALGASLELGVGAKGIINAGLSYRL
ncbi:MAG: hypothetical protein KJ578_13230 [Bacteroidetes bacterium]|nr:hypothetical protein [Bacteroidota bacterium]MBU1578813.1 hypothetical protein [Bacteroidota bacterium]MBU2464986.1 hypothetical protein [Bacteroidota bacterium]MBU2558733.1 hypothetical protein [Bacteroidota bacterium]